MGAACSNDWLTRTADEPAFGLDRSPELQPSARWSSDRAGAYLAHAVAREPSNLRAHVQRIALWRDHRDRHQLYGALLDLFFALGAHGAALRTRLLAAAEAVLAPEAWTFLDRSLADPADPGSPHPASPASVLTRGVEGRSDAIARIAVVTAASSDPVAEARAYLSEGNVIAAQELLEAALARNPTRADAAGELLALYRHARDAAGLEAMRERIGPRLVAPAAWDDAARAIAAAAR